jgi:hypothetical protein
MEQHMERLGINRLAEASPVFIHNFPQSNLSILSRLIHAIIICIYDKKNGYPQKRVSLNNLKRFIYAPI